jgi:hypothetical protein
LEKSKIAPAKPVAIVAAKTEVEPAKKTESSKTTPVKGKEYPSPDIRGALPKNAHPDPANYVTPLVAVA